MNSSISETVSESIDEQGAPVVFKVRQGTRPSPLLALDGEDVIKVEARKLPGQQKEAMVTDGANGSVWRMACDEGKQLHGTDLAPFPLGYFSAGMQADLQQRMRLLADQHDVAIDELGIWLINPYWTTGSFVNGTAEGFAEPSDIEVRIKSGSDIAAIKKLIATALDASPIIAMQRDAITDCTFALYINGRRRDVVDVPASPAADVADPFKVYTSKPVPIEDPHNLRDIIGKTGEVEDGVTPINPSNVVGKGPIRNIYGLGNSADIEPLYETDTWLGLPGSTHYRIDTDAVTGEAAPSPFVNASVAVAFCYLTQLTRFIQIQKLSVDGVRIVQFNPFRAGAKAVTGPIDTHLFLNGEAAEEVYTSLLYTGALTCYMHASVRRALEPNVTIVHNGTTYPLKD